MAFGVGFFQGIDSLPELLQFSLVFRLDFEQAFDFGVVLIGEQAFKGRFILLLAMQFLLLALKLLFLSRQLLRQFGVFFLLAVDLFVQLGNLFRGFLGRRCVFCCLLV